MPLYIYIYIPCHAFPYRNGGMIQLATEPCLPIARWHAGTLARWHAGTLARWHAYSPARCHAATLRHTLGQHPSLTSTAQTVHTVHAVLHQPCAHVLSLRHGRYAGTGGAGLETCGFDPARYGNYSAVHANKWGYIRVASIA